MVKLRSELLRYLTAEELRLLHAVETGMRQYEYVPAGNVIASAVLCGGGTRRPARLARGFVADPPSSLQRRRCRTAVGTRCSATWPRSSWWATTTTKVGGVLL